MWKLVNKSLIKYILVGSSAFVVDYLTLLTLYYYVSTDLMVATSAGFLAGFAVSFILNRQWVFGKDGGHRSVRKQLIEYVCLVIFNYFFTVLGVKLLNQIGVVPWIGKVLIMVLVTIWNYLLFSRYIFTPKR